jgi:hypothetical protein
MKSLGSPATVGEYAKSTTTATAAAHGEACCCAGGCAACSSARSDFAIIVMLELVTQCRFVAALSVLVTCDAFATAAVIIATTTAWTNC